jgi:hypothetical protein
MTAPKLSTLAISLVLVTAATAQPASAQVDSTAPQSCQNLGNYAFGNDQVAKDLLSSKDFREWPEGTQKQFLALSGDNLTKFACFAGGTEGYHKFLQAVEDARMDKQTGAGATSEGTTSVVSKGIVSQVMALAVEEGALTRTDNKSIATFHGNGLAIARLFAGHEQFPYCAIYDHSCESALARRLGGVSFSISFDTTQSTGALPAATTPSANKGVLASGPAQQVSGWGLRYDFNAPKNTLATQFQQDFSAKMKSVDGTNFVKSVNELMSPLDAANPPNQAYVAWKEKYLRLLARVSHQDTSGMADVLHQAVVELTDLARKNPKFQTQLDTLLSEMGHYFGTRDKALEAIVNWFTGSFEYNDDRPQNQPSQSNLKVILSWRPSSSGSSTSAGPLQLTLNGSAAWYDHAPPQGAVKRFRDAQASLQADRTLPDVTDRLGAALTLGYYFQYMADNALLTIPSGNLAPGTSISLPGAASVLLGTKGAIHIAQLGLTLTVKSTGVKVPLTLSYSNRTELIKANDVRGHFGVSYDLDSLFAGRSTTP